MLQWLVILVLSTCGNDALGSIRKTSSMEERNVKFLQIFSKKALVEAESISVETIGTTSTIIFTACAVEVSVEISTRFCAFVAGRRRRSTNFQGQLVFQEHGAKGTHDLHSGLLEDSRFLQSNINPRFLKVFVKETWTSVQTVVITDTVYVTRTSTTTVKPAVIITTTVYSTIFVPANYNIARIPECKK